MERQTVIVVAIALVSVLAIGFAAATVSETVQPGESGDGGADGGLIDLDLLDQTEGSSGPLGRIVVVLLALAFAGIVLYLLDNRSETVEIVAFLLVPAVVLAVFVLLVTALLDAGRIPIFGDGLPGFGESAGEAASSAIPVAALVAVFAVVLLLIAVALRRSGNSQRTATLGESDREGPSSEPQRREAVGEIAGRAADRIEELESRSVENEVYRAWDEMTDRLDVRDEASTTPREFARVAADAGLSPEDVDELTTLFEDVRYGGYSATSDREQRAVSVLRRIEQEYR